MARRSDGSEIRFPVKVRLDSDVGVGYYRNGGILHTALRRMAPGEMSPRLGGAVRLPAPG